MGRLTISEVKKWDPKAVDDVFRIAKDRAADLHTFGEDMQRTQNSLADWSGDTGTAFHDALGRHRTDITAAGRESANVAQAVNRAEYDIENIQIELGGDLKAAEDMGLTVSDDWKVTIKSDQPDDKDHQHHRTYMQGVMDELSGKADKVDDEIALAIRAAVGEQDVDSEGRPTGPPHDPPAPPKPTGPVPSQAIDPDSIEYSGAGTWDSGEDATRGYINQALDAMGITDPQARQNWMDGMLNVVAHESSFNSPHELVGLDPNDPNVQNSTYNLVDGYGNLYSRGPAQCVPGTFAANHQPGTSNNIYDPVANIAADMNHLMVDWGVSRDGSNLQSKVAQAQPNPGPGPHGQ